MTIGFIGHPRISSGYFLINTVKEQIRKNITRNETVFCYLGGCEDFDRVCNIACENLKKEYDNIHSVYVTTCINESEQEKFQRSKSRGIYNSLQYIHVGDTSPGFCMVKRNEWIAQHADLIIVYAPYNYGGVYQLLKNAEQNGKKIINICGIIN